MYLTISVTLVTFLTDSLDKDGGEILFAKSDHHNSFHSNPFYGIKIIKWDKSEQKMYRIFSSLFVKIFDNSRVKKIETVLITFSEYQKKI